MKSFISLLFTLAVTAALLGTAWFYLDISRGLRFERRSPAPESPASPTESEATAPESPAPAAEAQ